jgi:A/G-specific adenine glycosylase
MVLTGNADQDADDFVTLRRRLMSWFDGAARILPWREDRTAYRVWVSEIMLQQTRVDQVMPYFARFMEAFPDVERLAAAPLDDVLRVWEGLGYYSRARNMHTAARRIVEQHGGRVPDTMEEIRRLPGIGPYTAAAVLSIACEQPFAAVDGNVARVASRLLAMEEPVASATGRRKVQALADSLLDPARPGAFNEAMMELGATLCTPRSPRCMACPISAACGARASGNPEAYPRRVPRKAVPHYDVAVGVILNAKGETLIQRRPEAGLLGGLWEFPGGKREGEESVEEACRRELHEELGVHATDLRPMASFRHAYSHFRITMHPFLCRVVGEPRVGDRPMAWVQVDALADYAFPRANRRLIEDLTRILTEEGVVPQSRTL